MTGAIADGTGIIWSNHGREKLWQHVIWYDMFDNSVKMEGSTTWITKSLSDK